MGYGFDCAYPNGYADSDMTRAYGDVFRPFLAVHNGPRSGTRVAQAPCHALESLETEADDFVVLHDLLALAGAGDLPNLDRWLHTHTPGNSASAKVLPQLGQGLRAFANGDYGVAAAVLRENMPRLSAVGGSDAQRQLFDRITEFADAASR
jgi:hypothetical protein